MRAVLCLALCATLASALHFKQFRKAKAPAAPAPIDLSQYANATVMCIGVGGAHACSPVPVSFPSSSPLQAHPDDLETTVAGTVALLVQQGGLRVSHALPCLRLCTHACMLTLTLSFTFIYT